MESRELDKLNRILFKELGKLNNNSQDFKEKIEEIYELNLPIANEVSENFKIENEYDREDLQSLAQMLLFMSISHFNPEKHHSFEIFAKFVLHQKLPYLLKFPRDKLLFSDQSELEKFLPLHSLTELPLNDNDISTGLFNLLEVRDRHDGLISSDIQKCLSIAYKKLRPAEKLIIRERYLKGDRVPYSEIASRYHVSGTRIQQINAKALRKLRFEFRKLYDRKELNAPVPGDEY